MINIRVGGGDFGGALTDTLSQGNHLTITVTITTCGCNKSGDLPEGGKLSTQFMNISHSILVLSQYMNIFAEFILILDWQV